MSAEETAPHLTTRAVCRRDAALLRKELDISGPVSRRSDRMPDCRRRWSPIHMLGRFHPGPCGRQIL